MKLKVIEEPGSFRVEVQFGDQPVETIDLTHKKVWDRRLIVGMLWSAKLGRIGALPPKVRAAIAA